MYSEHAGQRSDFIIVGHPEFQMGKVPAARSSFPQWDTRTQPTKPGKHLARARSTSALVNQLSDPGPIGDLKMRALEKSRSKMQVLAPSSPRGQLGNNFDAFEEELMRMAKHEEAAPKREQKLRTAAGCAQAKGSSATCRQFGGLHKDVMDIREKLKANPKQTREALLQTGAWKYYATHLEQAKQMEDQLRHDRARMEDKVRKIAETPTGMMAHTH
eukprot:CAMPEP_0197630458 /NCGR_PEP_ID=MMETSP1338-20131121/7937_1 /TAXON_ID=43686 ORGANISM="Pelagodinium beii, Strain RCC1491" /NCGR_SAMPLE_ID=MMETSP1338 /ASSEMBLY_ACC=CAM_ASM_000754 /LENGTH=215 /DNA_ID=CAMNT_0043201677 /DNA_START=97 /DNA_END=744 /DNA_ORIENTATION=-